ncbi:hypothetical protein VSS74_01340 [Conexibacter stalactiti]|uniref:ApeA N-terminal domain-containing protein n=1 Tax=Conexibacter stalactiti TaxID=1940611 RepID=A0ABU4HI29_9ACTN|nr:hypothetical protein [Conexibacter stalactiti]MDW5592961.1 hypothetical protein [Conexibacter stalactiti]MEC5033602.1 hypothetical protein [Conexibacter stalactiti]
MPSERSTRVEPIYRPNGNDGAIIVYAGKLAVEAGGTSGDAVGQLELRLFPGASFGARFSGPPSKVSPHLVVDLHASVTGVPPGSSLTPPTKSSLPSRPGRGSWVESNVRLSNLDAGELSAAVRFVVHLSQSFQHPEFRVLTQLADGSRQGQVAFRLPGWNLVLAPIDDPRGDHDFGAAIAATPTRSPVDTASIERLQHYLFFVLSLVSSREVGIGPTCGLDRKGRVVWANWGSPRLRPEKSFATWCPKQLVPTAVESVADGYAQLGTDRALEVVVERAINHLLSADSSEVLDVRVPVACTGLELLSWAVLRRQGWITQDTSSSRKLDTAARLRLLLAWAGVSADIPDGFDALLARKKALGKPDDGGPETLHNVRNAVIHAPRKFDDPEWPDSDELFEAWQLSTWCLQLCLLRVLGYDGDYWSRLRLARSSLDVEPVPWAAR